MKLIKWQNNPALFNGNWNSFFNDDLFGSLKTSRPAVNIFENEEGYNIEVAAPGLAKEDFQIELDKNILNISVAEKEEKTEEKKGYTLKEFHYGSFKRSFVLPEVVEVEKISGSYQNGILHVALPKKAEVKQAKRAIEVA